MPNKIIVEIQAGTQEGGEGGCNIPTTYTPTTHGGSSIHPPPTQSQTYTLHTHTPVSNIHPPHTPPRVKHTPTIHPRYTPHTPRTLASLPTHNSSRDQKGDNERILKKKTRKKNNRVPEMNSKSGKKKKTNKLRG